MTTWTFFYAFIHSFNKWTQYFYSLFAFHKTLNPYKIDELFNIIINKYYIKIEIQIKSGWVSMSLFNIWNKNYIVVNYTFIAFLDSRLEINIYKIRIIQTIRQKKLNTLYKVENTNLKWK